MRTWTSSWKAGSWTVPRNAKNSSLNSNLLLALQPPSSNNNSRLISVPSYSPLPALLQPPTRNTSEKSTSSRLLIGYPSSATTPATMLTLATLAAETQPLDRPCYLTTTGSIVLLRTFMPPKPLKKFNPWPSSPASPPAFLLPYLSTGLPLGPIPCCKKERQYTCTHHPPSSPLVSRQNFSVVRLHTCIYTIIMYTIITSAQITLVAINNTDSSYHWGNSFLLSVVFPLVCDVDDLKLHTNLLLEGFESSICNSWYSPSSLSFFFSFFEWIHLQYTKEGEVLW